MGHAKEKVLLLLLGGLALACSYTPHKQWRAVKTVSKEWKKLSDGDLRTEVNNLYRSKLLKKEEHVDGTFTFALTEKGRLRALNYNFKNLSIAKNDWDGKWRFIVFDIPEKFRIGRDALRNKIKKLGFRELQKSVFVFPYKCQKEVEFIIKFFGIGKFVRYGTMDFIDNEQDLKDIFGLK